MLFLTKKRARMPHFHPRPPWKSARPFGFAMSAYLYRIDEGLQFFALQSGIAERCIKAIQDFAYSGFGGRGGKHDDIFWDNESYAIKQYLKMFADLASATLKQVADWFIWLASTLGRFFDERSGRSTSRKGGACYRRDARKPSAMPTSSDVPTMKSTTLLMADTMGEYRSTSKDLLDR